MKLIVFYCILVDWHVVIFYSRIKMFEDSDEDIPELVPLEPLFVDKRRVPVTIITGFLGK